ncbi:unnamed protein product [Trifolium pratense]|uniref:Uncharacterized protein n=1 Tax=Trifolium pratense TaxID=57577 RepID=A0ACB0ITR2_TRIPR|nr:unnamed protein product [Trifolium pratense]
MSLKSIVKNGIGSGSSKRWISRSKSHVASDVTPIEPIQQGQWANLPPELLLDIIRQVEESETSWPARAVVVYCASVCKSWRSVTKEIIKNLQQCGKITFPISLKQPGPRDHLMKCFIRRIKGTSTFLLYLGSMLSKNKSSKFLLAAKRIKRAARIDFVISLAADDFSPASNKYVGKLRSNFWCNKFTICDSQPPHDASVQQNCRTSKRFNSKQVSPKSARCHLVSTISNVLFFRKKRNVHCIMNYIPISAIQKGGNAGLTPTSLPQIFDETICPSSALNQASAEPLILQNNAPMLWDDRSKSFQLVAAVDPSHNVSPAERKRIILQCGMIEKDIFVMDYSFPISAFEAFAICLTSM